MAKVFLLLQRTKAKKKILVKFYFVFYLGPQNGQNCFFNFVFNFSFKRQRFRAKFWNWGPITVWYNMTRVQFISSKVTPP